MNPWQQIQQRIRAQVNHWSRQRDDPEETLERLITELQEQLCYLRQAIAAAIATQKRLERQGDQALRLAADWHERADQAMQQDHEDLARHALTRWKSYQNTYTAVQTQCQTQRTLTIQLKQTLATLESRVFAAKTQKEMLVARARSAETSEKLYRLLNNVGTRATLSAFERMEDKVLDLESQADAIATLSPQQLEQQIAALGQADDIEQELVQLKPQGKTDGGRGT